MMFGLFSKGTNQEPKFVYDQGVIIALDLKDIEDLNSKKQKEVIEELEEKIKKVLPDNSGVDGHEFGDGEVILYIYGPNAEYIFKPIEPILKKSRFNSINVTLQYGLPDNPNTKERKFTL